MCGERIGAIVLRIAELIRTKRLKLKRMTRKQDLFTLVPNEASSRSRVDGLGSYCLNVSARTEKQARTSAFRRARTFRT